MPHVTTTSFLGLVISPGRIEMDPEKVQAVASWPTPSNRKELQPHVRMPPPIQRYDREAEPGPGDRPPPSLSPSAGFVGQESGLGGVDAQFPSFWLHWHLPFPLCPWFPGSPSLSLSPGGLDPVPEMSMGVDLGAPETPPSSSQAQDPRRPSPRSGSHLPARVPSMALHQEPPSPGSLTQVITPIRWPFPVSKIIYPVSVLLSLTRSVSTHPTFHVSNQKPVRESSLVPASRLLQPPRFLDDGQQVYAVRKLLAVRKRGRGYQYLVD